VHLYLSRRVHERLSSRRAAVLQGYDGKLQEFLDFVLGQYVEREVGELTVDRLPSLLELKYRDVVDAAAQLGGDPKKIRKAFILSQRELYMGSG
jgi:type I restriction enzyme R subunit